ncbi:MAG TPA: chloride channel protein [Candidatus Eisenbacteria bacterium]|nr:chloride channel protein [Candidatus Eisenbacteria bacterium]
MTRFLPDFWKAPRLGKCIANLLSDLESNYSRDLHKWLVIAPVLGVATGLLITLLVKIILNWMWPAILKFYLAHPAWIVLGLAVGFLLAGLLMQYLTPHPNEHSTEEVIRSYHEHQGDIRFRPFIPKLLAAIATVGFGGSAALEGPSIYGGGAIGSWIWTRVRKLGFAPRDRRILLISGAAAGMSAVFRAPLTGIVFALEMPYKDDLAHEALLPSLIASVTSYATMAAFLGAKPIFDFVSSAVYTRRDLLWSAALGGLCGLAAMIFGAVFRWVRQFFIAASLPHFAKMVVGGLLTGICGWTFLFVFNGQLIPIGPNYEALPQILQQTHSSAYLLSFGATKLAATLCSLGVGGVSAMFVPLFLTGSSFGVAFAQTVVHSSSVDLFAAVGMAAFLAGGYKTPLAAVVFVAEATGGHGYIVPALIGAAVAYAVSGEGSISGEQRLHESIKVEELANVAVGDVMRTKAVSARAEWTLSEFVNRIGVHHRHSAYPVLEAGRLIGTIATAALSKMPPERWASTLISEITERGVKRIPLNCDLHEALRLLMNQEAQHMLLVMSETGELAGILTKTDVLYAMNPRGPRRAEYVSDSSAAE